MQTYKTTLLALLLLFYCLTQVHGQEIDQNLIIGKWKFVKTTIGQPAKDYKYNGDPLLTFESNGRWITEDYNPNYRQRGTWKIEDKNLVRDPDKTENKDIPPYPRKIEKLTPTELVFSAFSVEGLTTITFYFTKIEQ